MPLIPAMRPLSAISITAAMPISAPPSAEASGVNSVTVMWKPRHSCVAPRDWPHYLAVAKI